MKDFEKKKVKKIHYLEDTVEQEHMLCNNFLNAFLNSKLNIVYITGLTQLFMYPSQVVSKNTVIPGRQVSVSSLMHIASRILHVKNGTQHIKNIPGRKKKSIFLI